MKKVEAPERASKSKVVLSESDEDVVPTGNLKRQTGEDTSEVQLLVQNIKKRPKIDSSVVEIEDDKSSRGKQTLPLRDISNLVESNARGKSDRKALTTSQDSGTSDSTSTACAQKSTLAEWHCVLCTYLNSKRAMKCVMCGTKVNNNILYNNFLFALSVS